jgi:hypothetical protein
MVVTDKSGLRKRKVVGWREQARKVTDIRTRHRTPPPPQAKRAT